jgi:hypothetical protein
VLAGWDDWVEEEEEEEKEVGPGEATLGGWGKGGGM